MKKCILLAIFISCLIHVGEPGPVQSRGRGSGKGKGNGNGKTRSPGPVSPSLEDCGERPSFYSSASIQMNIVNGQNVQRGYPWQVGLFKYSDFRCGGSIIAPQWVITAKHCVSGRTDNMKVRAGMVNKNDLNQETSIQKVYHEPSFDADISILLLKEPFTFDSNVGAVCLPDGTNYGDVDEDRPATVTGWGRTLYEGQLATTLQEATVNIVTLNECRKLYHNISSIKDYELCAFRIKEDGNVTDACNGDSGGPLMQTASGNPEKWVLHGVVSRGVGCADPKYPGVYVRVNSFVEWINDVTSGNLQSKPGKGKGRKGRT